MARRHLSQRDVSDLLGGAANGWSQSRVAKIITGRVELRVDDVAEICQALSLSIVEAMRDHGLEFLAEMVPTELRVLERYRQLTQAEKDALVILLRVHQTTPIQERRALRKKIRRGIASGT